MHKRNWMILAASLVLIGCLIFVGVMTMLKWDFKKLSTEKYETNEYTFESGCQNISIKADTAKIEIFPADGDVTSVVCYEQSKLKHSVSVVDGTLFIEFKDTRKWYEMIGVSFSSPQITVALPRAEYGALSIQSHTGKVEIAKDLVFESISVSQSTGDVFNYASAKGGMTIKTTTGDILVKDVNAGSLELSVTTGTVIASGIACEGEGHVTVTTGRTFLTDVKCRAFTTSGDTGSIELKNVVVDALLSVERSTGDVKFVGCDAAELYVKTSTGGIWGTLLSAKDFVTKTDTGKVRVPSSTTGGRCEITTSTGDIRIEIVGE